MALFNYATKEITLKVVYYGPGLSGKTTNIQYLHENINPQNKGKLLSLATEADRTLFFDFLPVDLGSVKGFRVKFQLYTVPGQVRYNATRRLVLKGADAVVFVADSQKEMKDQNIQSYENMKDNLKANGLDPEKIPLVLQWNKRDLPNAATVEELDATLNDRHVAAFEAIAVAGDGVQETFKEITRLLVAEVMQKYQTELEPAGDAVEEKPPTGPTRKPRRLRPRPQYTGTSAEAVVSGMGSEQMFDPESFDAGGREGEEGDSEEGTIMNAGEEIAISESAPEPDAPVETEEVLEGVEEFPEDMPATAMPVFEGPATEPAVTEESVEEDFYAVPPRSPELEPGYEPVGGGDASAFSEEIAFLRSELEKTRHQNEEILATLKEVRALLRGSRGKWVRLSLK